MSKTISAELAAHYAQETTTLATLWKVTRRDGTVYAFTDHDEKIPFEAVDYLPTSVYDAGTVKTSSAMNVDDVSLTGLLAIDAVTAADIEAGLWDGATVEIMEVNYADLSMGANVLRYGQIGEIQRNGPQYMAELRGLMQYLQNVIGRIVTPQCDADLGDIRCGVNIEALRVSGTVTTGASTRIFTADIAASGAADDADYFTYGVVTWTGGTNDGLEMEVKQHQAGGVFTLQLDMPNTIDAGDTFTVVPGCNKIGRTGDCKIKFDNLVNFRGFEDVPGQDKVLIYGGQ